MTFNPDRGCEVLSVVHVCIRSILTDAHIIMLSSANITHSSHSSEPLLHDLQYWPMMRSTFRGSCLQSQSIDRRADHNALQREYHSLLPTCTGIHPEQTTRNSLSFFIGVIAYHCHGSDRNVLHDQRHSQCRYTLRQWHRESRPVLPSHGTNED